MNETHILTYIHTYTRGLYVYFVKTPSYLCQRTDAHDMTLLISHGSAVGKMHVAVYVCRSLVGYHRCVLASVSIGIMVVSCHPAHLPHPSDPCSMRKLQSLHWKIKSLSSHRFSWKDCLVTWQPGNVLRYLLMH